MMKKLISCFTVLIMVITVLSSVIPAYAASPKEVVFKADRTEAHPGDVITYSVTLGPIEHLNNGGFFLVIPEGLTFIKAEVPNGLKNTLAGSGQLEWTPQTLNLGWYGDADYSSSKDTLMLTFTCKVNEGATGVKQIKLDGDEDLGNTSFQSIEGINWNLSGTKVTITPKPTPVAVTGVSLNKTSLSLKVGETSDLTATVSPNNAANKAVSWKSSDASIAKVDSNGKVTAVKAGTATITVTTADGNKKATCSVTVKAAEVPVTKYNLTTSVNGGHGSVNGAQNGIEKGKTVTVVFAPDKDYEIDWVTVNGVETGVLANVLDITMNENKAVVVKYKKIGAAATEPPVTSAPTESTDPTDTSKPTDETTGSTEPTDTSAPTESTTGTPDGTESTSKPTDGTTENGADRNKETPNSLSWLWIVLVIVVVLAGGGSAAFIIIKKKKNTQE